MYKNEKHGVQLLLCLVSLENGDMQCWAVLWDKALQSFKVISDHLQKIGTDLHKPVILTKLLHLNIQTLHDWFEETSASDICGVTQLYQHDLQWVKTGKEFVDESADH